MGKVIMSGIVPKLVAPSVGIALADIAEGSLVKLNENGNPVEFYVACHDYESAQNGTGRTLLVRKDVKENVLFSEATYGVFYGSLGCELNSWMEAYAGCLDESAQTIIATTKIAVTTSVHNTQFGGHVVTNVAHAVFALSLTELGLTATYAAEEGTELPTASLLRTAKMNGAAASQWTRSIYNNRSTYGAYYVDTSGTVQGGMRNQASAYGARPCFTLPATALFNEETLLFKGVS